jgi:hypothetical protein
VGLISFQGNKRSTEELKNRIVARGWNRYIYSCTKKETSPGKLPSRSPVPALLLHGNGKKSGGTDQSGPVDPCAYVAFARAGGCPLTA